MSGRADHKKLLSAHKDALARCLYGKSSDDDGDCYPININSLENTFTLAVDYDASNNPIYVGYAVSGSAKNAAVWRIMKITYDVNNNPTDVQWADGDVEFNNIWDNRVGGSYS